MTLLFLFQVHTVCSASNASDQVYDRDIVFVLCAHGSLDCLKLRGSHEIVLTRFQVRPVPNIARLESESSSLSSASLLSRRVLEIQISAE